MSSPTTSDYSFPTLRVKPADGAGRGGDAELINTDMPSVELVALIGNPQPDSRTAKLAGQLVRSIAGLCRDASNGVVLDLGRLLESNGAPLGPDVGERYADTLAVVSSARVLVVASPAYKATYTGLLKSFLDHVQAGALCGVLAVPVMTVGAPAHRMAADIHLRPLLLELGARTPTSALVVQESDLDDVSGLVSSWIEKNRTTLELLLNRSE